MKTSDRVDRADRADTTRRTDSSVVTSLRALAELEDERVARERTALIEVARAQRAAEARREEEEAARRRREEDERVAVTTAAVERVRLEHQAERERVERERGAQSRFGEAEARRVADDRLREAERLLAGAARGSRSGLLLVTSIVAATLAVCLLLCFQELRSVQRTQTVLAATAAAGERALTAARAENAQLTHDYGVARSAARDAARPADTSVVPVSQDQPPAALPTAAVPHRHAFPPSSHGSPQSGCNPHDPLCGDVP